MDIVGEIKNLPNLGYDYYKDNGDFCIVVLGGESCAPCDNYRFWESIHYYHGKLVELYENKPFSEDVKDAITYCMKKMRSACEGRTKGTYTLPQQADYIEALSTDERQQIEEQVLMYKECYAIYIDCLRRR
jgi:hypothetical protein